MSEKSKQKPQEEQPAETPPERVLLYTMSKWKGIVDVYQCAQCDFSDESEDTMKLHVLAHFPEAQRDAVLNKLVYMEGQG